MTRPPYRCHRERPRGAAALVVGGLVVALAVLGGRSALACSLAEDSTRVVARVETGDVIIVEAGAEVKLIGALPPEAFDGATALVATGSAPAGAQTAGAAPAAISQAALTALVGGKAVQLAVGGRRVDRYGLLLAHAFVGEGDAREWVQGRLIADGMARAFVVPGSVSCVEDMLRLEDEARRARRGHWASGIFSDRDAGAVYDLLRLADTFQSVTGRVVDVTSRRDGAVLSFATTVGPPASPTESGDGGRLAFTAVVPVRVSRGAGRISRSREAPAELASLVGSTVRVRGWIERDAKGGRGPMLRLVDRAEVEIVEPRPSADAERGGGAGRGGGLAPVDPPAGDADASIPVRQ